MLLDNLQLKGFKRFKQLDISFARRLNVFVGMNGAGKSTILSAISKMLSWYVSRIVSPKANGNGNQILESEIHYDAKESWIRLEAHDEIGEFTWFLSKSRKGAAVSQNKSDLSELTKHVKEIRENPQLESLPILVDYSVNRSVLSVPLRVRKHKAYGLFTAYENSFDRRVDFRSFFEWYREREDIQNELIAERAKEGLSFNPNDFELADVQSALENFLPHFKNIRVRRSPLRMEVTKAGQVLNVSQLSDGEKNLLAMVGDLARRLVIANPASVEPLSGCGVVLIDEVELHLHPAWQKDVLPLLMKTFPNIQFIVATHSPIALAQLNCGLFLERRKNSSQRNIAVYSVKDGEVASLLDPETGLIMSGEMDDAANEADEEFDRLLDGKA